MGHLRMFVLLLCTLLLTGCASTGGAQEGAYRTGLGTAPSGQVTETVRNILRDRYTYQIDREVANQENVFVRTEWKRHTLTEDEKKKDMRASRSRIEVRARPSTRSGGGVRDYRVDFKAVYQSRSGNGDWSPDAIPESRQEYFDEISQLLTNQFKSGLQGL